MPANLRKDFDDFLFAPVGPDFDGTPLTLATVLARLGVDPWEEAAELASLAQEPAMQRLTSRLESMPNAPSTAEDTVNVAMRLLALLHRAAPRKSPSPAMPRPPNAARLVTRNNLAIYWLIGIVLLLGAHWALAPRDTPPSMDTSISSRPSP
jgi:hypothetical protein